MRRYFLKGINEFSGKIKVKPSVRELIRFRRLNLRCSEYPFRKGFHIIFCRNVLIYFDEKIKRHVLSQFHRHLLDRGYLFLGHSEAMFGREYFEQVYLTVYRRQ